MYSYEDRMRAVRLYISLGKRIAATIRQLGYPTKNSLIGWCREYERSQDLPRRMATRAPKYSNEQKLAAVEHCHAQGFCISATIKALGYPCRNVLTSWVREMYPQARTQLVGRVKKPARSFSVKQATVVELCTRDESAASIARRLGVDRVTLYNWKNQLLGREVAASMKRKIDSPSDAEKADLERQIQELRRDVRKLQLERDILKKANELVKKDLGIGLQNLNNREKVLLADALKDVYSLAELLPQLGLARSTYFYHRTRLGVGDKYGALRHTITDIFDSNRRCYGYRRIQASLVRQRVCVSEKVVQRLMKEEHLVAPQPKRRRYRSYLGEIGSAPENLLNRDFHAAAPNEKWLTDITEFHLPAGNVYLSPMIDCFDGMVVSWSIGTHPDAELVNKMLDAAIETMDNGFEPPIVHSDRGAHYRWPGWLSRIADARLIRSMSRKGCSPDNAACEGFFGRLKTELFYPRNWQGVSIERFIQELDSYIRWYNEKRIKLSLGSLSPIEFRESLGFVG